MFLAIFLKELKRNLKNPTTYIFIAVIFVCTYIFASNLNPNTYIMGLSIVRENHNAPILIAKMMARFSVVGILFVLVMVGRAVTRDFQAKIHDFFFTLPLNKFSYLGGRFFGGLTANLFIYSGIVFGFIFGCLAIDPKYYGSFQISAFIIPTLVILIPNLLLIGSIFFALATLSRKMVTTYLAGVGFLMIYGLIQSTFLSWDNNTAKILLDPFGISALDILSRYWTVAEINVNQLPMDMTFLGNRIFWTIVSVSILFYTMVKFKFISILENKKGKPATTAASETGGIRLLGATKQVRIEDNFNFNVKKCTHLVLRECKRIVLHPAFIILTFMAMAELASNFILNLDELGVKVYPLTSIYLEYTLHIWIYMIPLTIFFSGMLIWRERDYLCNEFYDTLLVPDWLSYFSKLFTMMAVQFIYIVLAMLTGIGIQIIGYGYTEINLTLYIKHLFVSNL